MEENETPYSYLTEPFHEWIRTKLRIYFEELETAFFYGGKYKIFLEELGMSEQEFYERFLKPYEGLSPEQLSNVALIQTQLGYKYLKTYTHFLAKPVLDQYMNAIEWTILNISDLHLNGLNVEPDADTEDDKKTKYLKEPYNQCRCCGRPDMDPRDKPYGENGLKRCTPESTDKENYRCAAKWEKFAHKTHDWINRKLNFDSQPESIRYFLDRCQERFEFNLEHVYWTIGTTAEHKPMRIGPFIDREKCYV